MAYSLLEGGVPQNDGRSTKLFAAGLGLGFLLGLGCVLGVMAWHQVPDNSTNAIDMVALQRPVHASSALPAFRYASPQNANTPYGSHLTPPVYRPQVGQRNQPQVQVNAMRNAMRSSYMPTVPALSASSMARSQMQLKVNSAMNNLNRLGLGSPLAKFGLTVVAARQDPSLAPQVRDEFFNMDAAGQKQVLNLRERVIVRAASLKKDEMAGKTAPLGFWDPVGFSDNSDLLWFYREAELKHGRVSMLAVVGIFVGNAFHPFFGDSVPYVDFIQAQKVAPFWPALLLATGFLELMNGDVHSEETWASRAPGDFGFDPLGMKPKDAKGLEELQNKELNNGRLAMFAAMGLIFQEMVKDTNPWQ